MDKDFQHAPEQRREATRTSDPATDFVDYIHQHPHRRMDTCGPDCIPFSGRLFS